MGNGSMCRNGKGGRKLKKEIKETVYKKDEMQWNVQSMRKNKEEVEEETNDQSKSLYIYEQEEGRVNARR